MGAQHVESPFQVKPLEEMGNLREAGAWPLIRRTWWMIGLALLPVLSWASLAQIKEVSHVPGQVLPSGSLHAIQHLEGGIVSQILVQEAQVVVEGEVLLRLDAEQVVPERRQARIRLAGLEARAARLRALKEGTDPDFAALEEEFPDLVAAQRRVHQERLATLASRREVLEAQIAQRELELERARQELGNAVAQRELTGEMERIRKELVEHKAVSRVIYLETLRAHLAAKGEVERLEQQIQTLSGALEEVRGRREKLIADTREEASDELNVVINERTQVREQIAQMQDRVTRLEVRSPVRGVVQDLEVRTPGAFVQPGAVLMHVVPVEDHLEVEVQIPPTDVGRMKVGQAVVVKITSYDFSHFGALSGTLSSVSATTFAEGEKSFYKGIVTLAKAHLGEEPGQYPVLPGMLAQVDITLGEQRVLEALFNPLARSYHEAFKER